MNTYQINCGNLQAIFSQMSQNTIDFNSYLKNTVFLNNQVQSLIQKTFQSIGLNKLIIPAFQLQNTIPNQELMDLSKYLLAAQAKNVRASKQNENLLLFQVKEEDPCLGTILPKSSFHTMITQKTEGVLSSSNDAKRKPLAQLESLTKIEEQYLIQKKVKTQLLAHEYSTDSASDNSPNKMDIKVKYEADNIEEPGLQYEDKPLQILGVKVDKQTKATWYLVEWHQRKNGFKPSNSYVKREDLLKEHCQLIAAFFEKQLIKKIQV